MDYAKIDRLLEKTEKEFSFLKVGEDGGQLPIRDLFATLRDVAESEAGFYAIHLCAAHATAKVEAVLDTLGNWTEADLAEIRKALDELKELRKDPFRHFELPPVDYTKIDDALVHLESELKLAEPGTDGGQLPIRDLFSKLRDKTGGNPALKSLHEAAIFATDYVERVLEGLASWTEPELSALRGLLAQAKALRADSALPFEAPEAVAPPASFAGKEIPPTPAPMPTTAPAPAPTAAAEELVLTFDLESDGEMLKEFIVESYEHLTNIENGVLELEENPQNKETLNSIFRAFHTFKGSSGFLNLVPINKSAHELENLLDLARQDKLAVTTPVINIILEGGDVLKQFVVEMQAQIDGKKKVEPILIPTSALIVRVKAIARGEVPASAVPAPAAKAAPVASASAAADHDHDEDDHHAPAPAALTTKQVAQAKANAAAGPATEGKMAFVKVDTTKLDALFDLVGEMVIAQSLVAQDPDVKLVTSQRLSRNISHLSRITDELQKTAMSMRMVPIRGTFQKMNRVVRDISAKIGKQIDFVISGEDTELDRTIVEEISDPLLHMVRNSVDHGVETPEVRVAKGKPPQGLVELRAFHEGGNIVIQLIDNGAGLNTERILRKAKENGIIAPDAEPTEQEIFHLIFAPGFSTADVVSDISGRGVGMDVVRRNIEKLRGKIDIQSTKDKGSTFTIYLPLTLAIIEGLIVRVGKQRYILPTLSVRESLRVTPEMVSTLHETNEMVNVRGSIFPLVRLHELFKVPDAIQEATEGIVVMIEAGHDQAALFVDDLIGKQEVVIKSLGEQFKSVKSLAGAAILGDGTVGLILDAASLIHHGEKKK
ncbi:two-component system, chemotaxis family, sensor kinase CheA [Verrucomicrobium sp. GAS474]|nr:two-component system, chemotaxis family, sensor kinase CheA [Verrucomicrobium sp. GAS474]